MIVKFDHISYSCEITQEEEIKTKFGDYTQTFAEVRLQNLEIKKEFLKQSAEFHNIYLLQKQDSYPIEITAYPSCFEGAIKFKVDKEYITLFTKEKEATTIMLNGLGFREEEDLLVLKPMLDTKVVRIKLEEIVTDENWSYLDREGYGSLAFVVDNASRQKKKLDDLGIYTTEVQELMVNGKWLKIFFAKSAAGDVIEFIGMR